MNKTNKDLIISGNTISVNFSVNYFFKYFIEATGIDLLSAKPLNVEESDTTKVFDYLSGLVYAGNRANHKIEKTEGYITYEQASDMVYSMTPVDATKLLMECITILSGGEKNAQPQAAKKKRAS